VTPTVSIKFWEDNVSSPLKRAKTLGRHWLLQIQIRLGRFKEHLHGWRLSVRLVPKILKVMRRGGFKQNSASGIEFPPREIPSEFPVLYINLDYRLDRNSQTLEEFSRIDVRHEIRIPGITREIGALGCAESHLEALRLLEQEDFRLAMICEDDIEFLANREILENVISSFASIDELGVLCVANRVRGPRIPINKSLAISNNIQMAACYVVKPFAVRFLLESFSKSAVAMASGGDVKKFAIDNTWKELQTGKVLFAVPRAKIARQRRSYSDIEKKIKFYG